MPYIFAVQCGNTRNPGKVAFQVECVTETSGTCISINFIDTVWNIRLVGGVCSQKTKWC